MGIFGLLTTEEYKDMEYKKEWIRDNCSKGQHFVGENEGVCDACGKLAKLRIKNGQVVGWKW